MLDPLYLYRVYRYLYLKRIPVIPGLLFRLNAALTNCEIPPAATVGSKVKFMHNGRGVVLNHKTTVGDGVIIMPNVVIGQAAVSGHRHKLTQIYIGNRVLIGAGAVLIAKGSLVVGEGATIAALTLITKDVPPGMLAIGNPAKYVVPKPWDPQQTQDL